MIFVGSDVHVRNTYFYATDRDGRRRAHGRVANTSSELRSFCDGLLTEVDGEVQPLRFVLESTTNSRAVQRQLQQAAGAAGFDELRADVLDAQTGGDAHATRGSSPRAWPGATRSTPAC